MYFLIECNDTSHCVAHESELISENRNIEDEVKFMWTFSYPFRIEKFVGIIKDKNSEYLYIYFFNLIISLSVI